MRPPAEICLWCGRPRGVLLQPAVARLGGRSGPDSSFDVYECGGCRVRYSPQAAGGDAAGGGVGYDRVREHHAWYRLNAAQARCVADLLSQGPQVFWTMQAMALVNATPWQSDRRYREVFEHLTRARAEGRRLRVLEVGFGAGLLGGIAARLGHGYTGIDVGATPVQLASMLFGALGARYRRVDPAWFDRPPAPGDVADLVFCSEVIEHLARPRDLLAPLLARVAPAGALILTTPDLDASRDRVWIGDLPPIHTVFLHPAAVRAALLEISPDLRIETFNEDDPPRATPDPLPPPDPAHPGSIRLNPPAADGRAPDNDPGSPGFFVRVENFAWHDHAEPRAQPRPPRVGYSFTLVARVPG